MKANKADRIEGSKGKKNHYGQEIREVETKGPLPPQMATTPIPATMDQTRVEEGPEVTQTADQPEETLLTHKS